MPRSRSFWRYDVMLNGQRISTAMATLLYQASTVRGWHAEADDQILEEEVARELFPDIEGRYRIPQSPRFALKPEDRASIDHNDPLDRMREFRRVTSRD